VFFILKIKKWFYYSTFELINSNSKTILIGGFKRIVFSCVYDF
jgi:hypothetical protein